MFYPINKYNEGCTQKQTSGKGCKSLNEGKNPKSAPTNEPFAWISGDSQKHVNHGWEKLRR